MLGSQSHHDGLVVLKHAWVKFVGEELVIVISATENVVFTHAPGVHRILAHRVGVLS